MLSTLTEETHHTTHTLLRLELRAVSLTLHKSQCCSSVSQSFTLRHCSNNQSPCPNMLIHLLHPYSHGRCHERTHTHADRSVSSISNPLQTNTPFLHVRSVSDNSPGTLHDVGKDVWIFSVETEVNKAVGTIEMCGFASCFSCSWN